MNELIIAIENLPELRESVKFIRPMSDKYDIVETIKKCYIINMAGDYVIYGKGATLLRRRDGNE